MICRIFYPMRLNGEYDPVYKALKNDAMERTYSEQDLKEAMYWYRKKFNEDFDDYLVEYDTNRAVCLILTCLDYGNSVAESYEGREEEFFRMFDR